MCVGGGGGGGLKSILYGNNPALISSVVCIRHLFSSSEGLLLLFCSLGHVPLHRRL